MTSTDIVALLPILILAGYACALMLVDLVIPDDRKRWTGWLAFLGLVASAAGLVLWPAGGQLIAFNGMLIADGYSVFLNLIFLLAAGLTILIALNYLPRTGLDRGEFYFLLLFTVTGMMLMAQADVLIVVFLALELLSIPLYILSAFARPRAASEEAGLKYFLLGAFASAFLVYGIALVYGATGTTNLSQVFASVASGRAAGPLLAIGSGLVLVGLGFKVAVVPFHMWTPDVYDGAPSVVTPFQSAPVRPGAGHGHLQALAPRPAALGRRRGQVLRLPRHARRRLPVAGAGRRAHFAGLGLLLPAHRGQHVHARGRGPGSVAAGAQSG